MKVNNILNILKLQEIKAGDSHNEHFLIDGEKLKRLRFT